MSQLSQPAGDWADYRIPLDESTASPRSFRLVGKWRFLLGVILVGGGWYGMRASATLSGTAMVARDACWYCGAIAIGLGAISVLSFLLLNHHDTDVEELPTLKQ